MKAEGEVIIGPGGMKMKQPSLLAILGVFNTGLGVFNTGLGVKIL